MASAHRAEKPGVPAVADQTGAALLAALMVLVLLSALGAGLVFSSALEVRLAANDRDLHEARHAADAGLALAVAELAHQSDWTAVLAGAAHASFADGPPPGTRMLRDGSTIDLSSLESEATCGREDGCTTAERQAVTLDRPWGANNPAWRVFVYGPSGSLAAEPPGARDWYLVVLVGDDQAEQDDDPARDADSGEPGNGVLALRALALGPRGMRQRIDATVARRPADDKSEIGTTSGVRVLSWRAVLAPNN
ncbi:MAG TPA: pilus assembly PilX N-terminal domain-containing protein [Vicinamibacterales bacterium]|jgi:hypothetical protein